MHLHNDLIAFCTTTTHHCFTTRPTAFILLCMIIVRYDLAESAMYKLFRLVPFRVFGYKKSETSYRGSSLLGFDLRS